MLSSHESLKKKTWRSVSTCDVPQSQIGRSGQSCDGEQMQQKRQECLKPLACLDGKEAGVVGVR